MRLRPSSQKGGTIIAEDVTDRATHDRRIRDPDGYRPAFCPNCGERTLHVHDRQLLRRALAGQQPVEAMEALFDRLRLTATNAQFLKSLRE